MLSIKKYLLIMLVIFTISYAISISSALVIIDSNSPGLEPGSSGELSILVGNEKDELVSDVTMLLDFTGLPFSTIGGSSDSFNELDSDEEGTFRFYIKAFQDAKPGNYNVPYTLSYLDGAVQKGSIGLEVKGNPELIFSHNIDKPIIGEKTKIDLKIINRGDADAKFLTLTIIPEGFTLLSEPLIYFGTIDADDFSTASFDVILKDEGAHLTGIVKYEDFDNEEKSLPFDIDLSVYTQEEAIEKGLIDKNNSVLYIGVIVVIIVIWLIYRFIKRRMKRRKSQIQTE